MNDASGAALFPGAAPAAFSLAAIEAAACHADCPKCGAVPLEDCTPASVHLDRVIRALRYGHVSDGQMVAFLAALHFAELEAAFAQAPLAGAA